MIHPYRLTAAAAGPGRLEQGTLLHCIQLLGMLGSSSSEAAVQILSELEQSLATSESAAPVGLLDETIAALCIASSSGIGTALEAAALALNNCIERMRGRPFHDASIQKVLQQIPIVARSCHAAPHARQAPDAELRKQQDSLEQLVGTLDNCLEFIHAAETKEAQHRDAVTPTSWQTRVATAAAAVQLMEIDISLFEGEENSQVKEDCLERLARLLDDPCYQARSEAAKLSMFLFDKFKDVHVSPFALQRMSNCL